MNGTPLDKILNKDQIQYLEIYNIKTVEQLLALRKTSIGINLPNLNSDELDIILDKAEKMVEVPERSDKQYFNGAFVKDPSYEKYTLEQIKQAFWNTFHRTGEHWFPYKCTEEVSEEETQMSWENFEKNIK